MIKLAKVRPFIELLLESSKSHWTAHRGISIGEQMIGTRCRVGFIQ